MNKVMGITLAFVLTAMMCATLGLSAKPQQPTLVSPADASTNHELEVTLNVTVEDVDGAIDVTFYSPTTDTVIGERTGIVSGSYANVTWSGLDTGTEYEWYANATESAETNKSTVWSFNTSHTPTATLEKPTDQQQDVALDPELQVTVTDIDGDDATVEFKDNSDDSVICTVNSVKSGDKANCTWTGLRDKNTQYKWYVTTTDAVTSETLDSTTWSFNTEGYTAVYDTLDVKPAVIQTIVAVPVVLSQIIQPYLWVIVATVLLTALFGIIHHIKSQKQGL